MNNIYLNFLCAILMVLSNVLSKKSLISTEIKWNKFSLCWITNFFELLKKPLMWLAIFVSISANFIWVIISSSQKMNIAYPSQITLVFLISSFTIMIVFGERITSTGLIDLITILAGIFHLTKN